MKTRYWIPLLVAWTSGCLPPTLRPIYREDQLVFEPLLLGSWREEESAERWTFTAHDPRSYRLEHRDDKGRTGEFDVHLVHLGGELFADLYPMDVEEDLNGLMALHLLPMHTFARVQVTEEELRLSMMDRDWLDDYLADNPTALAHERLDHCDDDCEIITASTEDLQAFAVRHLGTEGAYGDWDVMKRTGG